MGPEPGPLARTCITAAVGFQCNTSDRSLISSVVVTALHVSRACKVQVLKAPCTCCVRTARGLTWPPAAPPCTCPRCLPPGAAGRPPFPRGCGRRSRTIPLCRCYLLRPLLLCLQPTGPQPALRVVAPRWGALNSKERHLCMVRRGLVRWITGRELHDHTKIQCIMHAGGADGVFLGAAKSNWPWFPAGRQGTLPCLDRYPRQGCVATGNEETTHLQATSLHLA